MLDFRQLYTSHIETIYPPLAENDGFPEPVIAATEQQMNLPLPQSLRTYYLTAGNRKDINASQNLLISPEELDIENEMMIFYRENQSVFLWAIRLADMLLDDPPVYMTENDIPQKWEPTYDNMSIFLISMLYYQASLGGLPYVGIVSSTEMTIPTAIKQWKHIELGASFESMDIFVQPGKVICIADNESMYDIYASGRTRDDFLEIDNLFGIDWDYCTFDDEE